jgi:hypothetical protein
MKLEHLRRKLRGIPEELPTLPLMEYPPWLKGHRHIGNISKARFNRRHYYMVASKPAEKRVLSMGEFEEREAHGYFEVWGRIKDHEFGHVYYIDIQEKERPEKLHLKVPTQ